MPRKGKKKRVTSSTRRYTTSCLRFVLVSRSHGQASTSSLSPRTNECCEMIAECNILFHGSGCVILASGPQQTFFDQVRINCSPFEVLMWCCICTQLSRQASTRATSSQRKHSSQNQSQSTDEARQICGPAACEKRKHKFTKHTFGLHRACNT